MEKWRQCGPYLFTLASPFESSRCEQTKPGISERTVVSKNTLKLYVGKAQLSGVQKMDPFLVQCSDVVSTFGQVPGGRTDCFCDNGALTQKRKPSKKTQCQFNT